MRKFGKIRPLVTLETKWKNLPPMWVREVMPHLMLGPWLPCWIWTGPVSSKGMPRRSFKNDLTGKRKYISMRLFVGRIFWKIPKNTYVTMTCGTINCLNPSHMVVKHRSIGNEKA